MNNVDFSKPGISFVTGVPISNDSGLLILSIDKLFHEKEPHSLLVVKKNGVARGILVPVNCCDVILSKDENVIRGYFLSDDGSMWCYNGETIEISASIDSDDNIQAFRSQSYSCKSEHLVAGGGNVVFLKKGLSEWLNIKIKMDSEIEQYKYVGFEKVLAGSNGEFYLFGWHGIGYIMSGGTAVRLNLPTNVDIYDAVLASNGVVYTCGSQGTVLCGRESDSWTVVANSVTDAKLWGICEYQGRIFVCSMKFIYEIVENELRQIEYTNSSKIPNSTYKLKSCDDCIWSIGSKHLVRYDGVDWHEVLMLK